MDANRLNFRSVQNQRYHGKRRNATFGNIRFNRNNDDDSAATASDSTLHVHRVREGGVQHRKVKFDTNSGFKYYLDKKDKDNDTIMRGNTNNERNDVGGTSRDTNFNPAHTRNNDRYRFRNPRPRVPSLQTEIAQGRLVSSKKLTGKGYKIGESNDENAIKFSVAPQPHCKLKTIEQKVFDLAVNFLREYFKCFDQQRDDLINAYHDKALYSLSINANSQATSKSSAFVSYFKDSRNIKHIMSEEKLYKILHVGNTDIAAFIKRFPATEHDLNSLKLDSCYFAAHTNVATNQIEQNPSTSNSISPNQVEQSEKYKQNMITEFSKISNLNLTWSKDCLEFADWDYEKAKKSFFEHKDEIPRDAFI